MSEGVFGRLDITKQTSFGTLNVASAEGIPFTDESLTDNINLITPETLTGSFLEVDPVGGLQDTVGDISMVMHPFKTGVLLRAVFGQVVTTTTNMASGSGLFEHEFIPKDSNFESGVALTPYTIRVFRDTAADYVYTDAMIHALTISLTTNDFLKMSASVIARTASLNTTVGSATTETDAPWVFDQASISLAGAGFVQFEDMEISFANNIEGVQTLDGTKRARFYHRTDKMQVRVSGTMNFVQNSQYIDYKSLTQKNLTITMRDTTATSGNFISIQIPKMQLETYAPNIGGPGRLQASFTALGVVDSNSSYSVRITMINSRNSYA